MKSIGLLLGLCCLAWAPASSGQSADAKDYFGKIQTPCHDKSSTVCTALLTDIRNLYTGNQCKTDKEDEKNCGCPEIDKPCPPGKRILRALFGDTYRHTLPDFIVYFEQKVTEVDKETEKETVKEETARETVTETTRGTVKETVKETVKKTVKETEKEKVKVHASSAFTAHKPVLMWKNQNTPHLYGVRDVYMIVFSERPACLEAAVTTEFKSEPNPFSFILTVLGKSFEPAKAKELDKDRTDFVWHPLDGNSQSRGMWWAIGRAAVDVNSTNRITILFKQPPKPEPKEKEEKPKKAQAIDECKPDAGKVPVYTGDFIAANAFFSNSPESWVTVALALGMTSNVRGTSLASGGSNQSFNGYALAKFYVIRPRLTAGPEGIGHRPSLGGVVGTNISGSAFDQLVLGVSLGHVLGNVGFTAGANSIKGLEGTGQGRKWRPFAGVDYSF